MPDALFEFYEHTIDENGVDVLIVDDDGELYSIPLDDVLSIKKSKRFCSEMEKTENFDDVKRYDDEIWGLLNQKNLPDIKDSEEKGKCAVSLLDPKSEVKEFFSYEKDYINLYQHFANMNERINIVEVSKLSSKEKKKFYDFWHRSSRPLESLTDYIVNENNKFSAQTYSDKHLRRKEQRKGRKCNQVNFSDVKDKGLKPELAALDDEAFITRIMLKNGFMTYKEEPRLFELLSPLNEDEKKVVLLKIAGYLHPEIIETLNLKTEARLQTHLRHIRAKITEQKNSPVALSPETKKCNKCGETKSVSLFGKNKHHSDGLQTSCLKCEAQRKKDKYQKSKKLKDKTNIGA